MSEATYDGERITAVPDEMVGPHATADERAEAATAIARVIVALAGAGYRLTTTTQPPLRW